MGKNQMSLKKMKTNIDSLKKQAKNISASNNKIKKTVENMNANIYHGGNAANDWYYTADVSCNSNENFLKRLDNSISILEKQYRKLYNAAHSNTEPLDASTSGATAGAMASAGAVAGSVLGGGIPSGNTIQTTITKNDKVSGNDLEVPDDKKTLVDNNNDARFSKSSKSQGRGDYTPGSSLDDQIKYQEEKVSQAQSKSDTLCTSAQHMSKVVYEGGYGTDYGNVSTITNNNISRKATQARLELDAEIGKLNKLKNKKNG